MQAAVSTARDLDAIGEHYLAIRKITYVWHNEILRILGKPRSSTAASGSG